MKLVPVSGVMSAVAKVHAASPDAAHTLIQFGLYESLRDQSPAARDEVEPQVLAAMADTLVIARKSLLRNHIGKAIDTDGNTADLPYAQGMAMIEAHIEKSLGDIKNNIISSIFNRQHPRDAKGRWISANIGSQSSANQSPEARQGSLHQEAQENVDTWKKNQLINEKTSIQVWHRLVDMDNKPIKGKAGEVLNTVTEANLEQRLTEIELKGDPMILEHMSVSRGNRPLADNAKQRVALDIMAAAVGGDGRTARRLTGALPMDSDGKVSSQGANGAKWNRPGADGDRQSFRRMSMTGQLLSNISEPGSTLDSVGGLAQLVGDLGPEAEKVLGPGIKRTAYRYRGTERRPAKAIVNDVREANALANELDVNRFDETPGAQERREAKIEETRTAIFNRAGGRNDPAAKTNYYWMDEHSATDDQRTMGMRGDAAVVNLLDELPDRDLTALSVESGELPPSQGVIINANGKVVTQAVGVNGDHYLPFDLKNLNALHGGQYVRTRAAGGPTTEDLYTGLLSGARQIQVVSNSGVYTVEFDPDLRGGRRYSDKAARMIDRYGKLLETIVTSSNLYLNDLSPEKKSEIRAAAMAGANGDKATYDANVTILEGRARMESEVTSDEQAAEMAEGAGNVTTTAVTQENLKRAKAKQPPMSTSERGQLIDDTRRAFEIKNKADVGVRRLRLDGPGYDRALKTLRQEFPYYIRKTTWRSLPDYLKDRNIANDRAFRHFVGGDKGHVAPGQTHALRTENWAKPAPPAAAAPVADVAAAPAADGTPAAAATQTVRAAATVGAGGAAQPISEAVKAGTPFAAAIAKAIGKSLGVLRMNAPNEGNYPDDDDTQKTVLQAGPSAMFVHWKLLKLARDHKIGAGGANAAYVKEMLDPATPELFMERTLDALPAASEMSEHAAGWDTAAVDEASGILEDLLSCIKPFAEPGPGDAYLSSPDLANPKPQSFSDIPATVGTTDYDNYLSAAAVRDPLLAATIKEFAEKYTSQDYVEHDGIAAEIDNDIEQYKKVPMLADAKPLEAPLAAKQKAWAFVTARHTASIMDEIGGTSGGAAPLAKGLARRQIIFHQEGDSFSQQVYKAFGRTPPGQPGNR